MVPLADIDPNETVEEWELVSSKNLAEKPEEAGKTPYDWQVKTGKREASQSPEDSRKPKRNNRDMVDDWQIAEFLHSFIEGSATKPNYANLNRGEEAGKGMEEAEDAGKGEYATLEGSSD